VSEPAAFLVYAGLFRLAIVAVGALSIWLGYRLFCTMTSGPAATGGTDAEAKVGDVHLSLRGAAPGTCFAVFGAVIVSIMLAKGMPEFNQREGTGTDGGERSIVLKGTPAGDGVAAPSSAFTQSLARADALLRDGNNAEAAAAYARALTNPHIPLGEAARAFNQLAWLQHLAGKHDAAVALARVAVGLDPGNADYLDTLARAEAKARGAVESAGRMEQRGENQP
jgi:tetratricopeptide (TPR) repeat protein